jgi:hypothetical protein
VSGWGAEQNDGTADGGNPLGVSDGGDNEDTTVGGGDSDDAVASGIGRLAENTDGGGRRAGSNGTESGDDETVPRGKGSTRRDETVVEGRAQEVSTTVDDTAVGGNDKDEAGSSGTGRAGVVADPSDDAA